MLKLILNEGFINFLFFVLAFLTPSIVVILVALLRERIWTGEARLWLVLGGAAGPLNLLLWLIYNAIENFYGLDSVRSLVINLILFLILGIVGGLIIRRYRLKLSTQQDQHKSPAQYDKPEIFDK